MAQVLYSFKYRYSHEFIKRNIQTAYKKLQVGIHIKQNYTLKIASSGLLEITKNSTKQTVGSNFLNTTIFCQTLIKLQIEKLLAKCTNNFN